MAGIGFELRRMMRKKTLTGLLQAYSYAALIGSGPWIISIIAILAIGLFARTNNIQSPYVEQFQVSISYLVACSLILTSPLQLMFSRFVADRIFEHREHVILPNFLGALTVAILAGAVAAGGALLYWIDGSFIFRFCMLSSFVLLCSVWIAQTFAAAIKAISTTLCVFVLGYAVTVGAALSLQRFGLEGLLLGFIIGQAILLFTLLALVVRQYPAKQLVAFSFLRRGQIFPELALTGLFYNLGVWADKFIFWNDPLTGVSIIGPLRSSPVYDLPIFLAYLSIIPGMAVFLMRMEIDLSEKCEDFYLAITAGGTLSQIVTAKDNLTAAIKYGLLEMLKVQAITTIVLLLLRDEILALFGISPLYSALFSVNLVAVAAQLVVLAILNVLFYLDQRRTALLLCLLFFIANTLLSFASLIAGPVFYGYGFAAAVLLTSLVALACLSEALDRLDYRSFMLQP